MKRKEFLKLSFYYAKKGKINELISLHKKFSNISFPNKIYKEILSNSNNPEAFLFCYNPNKEYHEKTIKNFMINCNFKQWQLLIKEKINNNNLNIINQPYNLENLSIAKVKAWVNERGLNDNIYSTFKHKIKQYLILFKENLKLYARKNSNVIDDFPMITYFATDMTKYVIYKIMHGKITEELLDTLIQKYDIDFNRAFSFVFKMNYDITFLANYLETRNIKITITKSFLKIPRFLLDKYTFIKEIKVEGNYLFNALQKSQFDEIERLITDKRCELTKKNLLKSLRNNYQAEIFYSRGIINNTEYETLKEKFKKKYSIYNPNYDPNTVYLYGINYSILNIVKGMNSLAFSS